MKLNNYPESFTNSHIKRKIIEIKSRIKNKVKNVEVNSVKENKKNIKIVFPYHGAISENIKRLLKKLKIKTIFSVNTKLDKFFKLGKDKVGSINQCNCVYKFECNCGRSYVGQTKGPLYIRTQEHIKNFERVKKYHNIISDHLTECNNDTKSHFIKWDNFKILVVVPNLSKRLFSEMSFIKKKEIRVKIK